MHTVAQTNEQNYSPGASQQAERRQRIQRQNETMRSRGSRKNRTDGTKQVRHGHLLTSAGRRQTGPQPNHDPRAEVKRQAHDPKWLQV